MANQIKYNSVGAFVCKKNIFDNTSTGDFTQLRGIQSVNFNVDNQINKLDSLGTNDWTYFKTNPIINYSFNYLLTNGKEEYALGISGISGLANLYEKQHNLYFIVDNNAQDINTLQSLSGLFVCQFTNSVLTNYNIRGQISSPVVVEANFQSLNFNIQQYTTGIYNSAIEIVSGIENSGAIKLPLFTTGFGTGVKFLTPNNLVLTVGTGLTMGTNLSESYINSFDIGVSFDRNILYKMGAKYPYKRCLRFPVELTLNLDATFINYKEDALRNIDCDDRLHDVVFSFREHCNTDREIVRYEFSGLRLINQQTSVSTSQRKVISFSFSKQMDAQDSFNFVSFID